MTRSAAHRERHRSRKEEEEEEQPEQEHQPHQPPEQQRQRLQPRHHRDRANHRRHAQQPNPAPGLLSRQSEQRTQLDEPPGKGDRRERGTQLLDKPVYLFGRPHC